MFNPGQIIDAKDTNLFSIYYVARGIVIEKNGTLDNRLAPQIKFNRGQIVALQNMLHFEDGFRKQTNIYCSQAYMCSVIRLDIPDLYEVLKHDK